MEKKTHVAIFDVNDALSLQLNAIKIRDEEDIPKAIDIAIAYTNQQIESEAAKGHDCASIDFSPIISQFPDSLRIGTWYLSMSMGFCAVPVIGSTRLESPKVLARHW